MELTYFTSVTFTLIASCHAAIWTPYEGPPGGDGWWTDNMKEKPPKPKYWVPGEKIPHPNTTNRALFRQEMRAIVERISYKERNNQSEIITKKVIALPEFKKAKSIGIYLSKTEEARTDEILKEIFAQNKTCYVPRAVYKTIDFVPLYSMKDLAKFVPINQLGIRQPSWTDKTRVDKVLTGGRTVDLLIVPGLAFTKEGDRMPDGVIDYMQQFIRKVKEECNPTLVGICLKQQLVPNGTIPLEYKDARMDHVITDDTINYNMDL